MVIAIREQGFLARTHVFDANHCVAQGPNAKDFSIATIGGDLEKGGTSGDLHSCWTSRKTTKDQWPFQEPKLEVPTIYKAYFLGLCKGISPENMALYGTVPPF